MATIEEIKLLTAFHDGNDAAFSQLYELYSRQLMFTVYRLTRDRETAEDIVAESFVKLIISKHRFNSLQKLKSFLFTTAQNAAIDWLRAKKRHQHSHTELRYLTSDAENEIERLIIYAEVLQHLHVEIQNLPPKYAEIITRSFIEGESISEISLKMGLTYKTIQNLKAKAVQQLRMRMVGDKLAAFTLFLFQLLPGD